MTTAPTLPEAAMPDEIDAADYRALAAKEKPRKYRNVPVVIDDIPFDSTAEGRRYEALKHLANAGDIHSLGIQVRFPIVVNEIPICTYVADFRYFDYEAGRWVYEDVKGVQTRVYRLKKKLVRALYGIDITEVEA